MVYYSRTPQESPLNAAQWIKSWELSRVKFTEPTNEYNQPRKTYQKFIIDIPALLSFIWNHFLRATECWTCFHTTGWPGVGLLLQDSPLCTTQNQHLHNGSYFSFTHARTQVFTKKYTNFPGQKCWRISCKLIATTITIEKTFYKAVYKFLQSILIY